MKSSDVYAECLEEDAGERRALVEEIVVSETWFFRDDPVFRRLSELAKSFRDRKEKRALRVLSIPCATGEEAYSVSIVILESGLSERQFSVQAIDVSGRALVQAERGSYGKNSFRSPSWQTYRSYFEPCDEGLAVVPKARSAVVFARGNVLDPSPRWAAHFDVILCRNLLIYLDRDARARALDNLHGWLAADGVLFAGHAEAVETMDPRFQRLDSRLHFAYRKRRLASKAPKPKVAAHPAGPPLALARTHQKLGVRFARSNPEAPRERRAPEATRARVSAPSPASLERATELANGGALVEAAALCERHIREAGPTAAAYCLLAIVRQAGSDSELAIESFNKALYLDPLHHESLVHLALIHERRGEAAQAEQYRRRAERAQSKAGTR